ncbi:sorbitol dehydrogenase [Domibacillus antri]|uniref:Sorbitol dehydrogenase n=2 Tax=Domibacillus antri TaxID=1714264 RepID=A0A1Q8Q6U2_9BACI|nr:alcohol dehydrogenase catalytic domain-containing protein [Domibacillus antri]OLN23066.1 sorbitol dehydrogenase [Domibacillus antri]
MRSLYLAKPGEILIKEDSAARKPEHDEVKIKLLYGGICGSDIGVFKGKIAHASYPVTPGHELLGTIIEKGSSVDAAVGTRVVVQPNSYCDECGQCQKGKTNLCLNKKSLGVNTDGGFAEEFTISSKYILPVPESLSDERAVLIEPFAVVVHAFKQVNITKGTSVAVIGCGTEGQLAIALASHLGAEITAIDINEDKLNSVFAYGNIQTSTPDAVTEKMKFDVVIEAAGVSQAVEQAVDVVKPGGSIVLIGLTAEATLPILKIVRNEISIHGSIIYHFPVDFAESVQYLSLPEFVIEPVIADIVPFNEYERAYEAAVSGQYAKIILNFKEDSQK